MSDNPECICGHDLDQHDETGAMFQPCEASGDCDCDDFEEYEPPETE